MRYFRKHLGLQNTKSEPNAVISVHCDIVVFSWLLQYTLAPPNTPAGLTLDNALPLFIASNFLQVR